MHPSCLLGAAAARGLPHGHASVGLGLWQIIVFVSKNVDKTRPERHGEVSHHQ
jgi:hypothetical protein